jgi:hypothetical protein
MVDTINVTGKVTLKLQFVNGGSNELLTLGEAQDMHDIEERSFWHNVPGDRHGGPQGPPIEVQYLGSIAVVRVELSRWDTVVMDELRKRKVYGTTLGTIVATDVGNAMLATRAFRLLLSTLTRPLNFPCVILRDAIPYGMGSKFTSVGLQFECHRMPATIASWAAEGVLYDATTAEY